MTTITLEENIQLDSDKAMSIKDFLYLLENQGLFPILHELPKQQISYEIQSAYEESQNSTDWINI